MVAAMGSAATARYFVSSDTATRDASIGTENASTIARPVRSAQWADIASGFSIVIARTAVSIVICHRASQESLRHSGIATLTVHNFTAAAPYAPFVREFLCRIRAHYTQLHDIGLPGFGTFIRANDS